MVSFFLSSKRCGHCKKLAPEWKRAAKNLKGKVKLGHVNCDVEQVITINILQSYIFVPKVIYSFGPMMS